MIVNYGNADAPVGGVNLGILAQKGSLYNTRPTLFDYYATQAERMAGADYVWDMFRTGAIKVTVGQTYALEDAARAHADLEGRRTDGEHGADGLTRARRWTDKKKGVRAKARRRRDGAKRADVSARAHSTSVIRLKKWLRRRQESFAPILLLCAFARTLAQPVAGTLPV